MSPANQTNLMPHSNHDDTNKAASPMKVLVVGAGMAGLTAARDLTRAGHEVIVLEARDRIGGRIWTDCSWESAPIDLGASWIHGLDNNPITELRDEFKAETVTFADGDLMYNTTACLSFSATGEPLTADQLTQRRGDIELVEERLCKKFKEIEPTLSTKKALGEMLKECNLSESRAENVFQAVSRMIEDNHGAGIGELALWAFTHEKSLEGAEVIFPKGYGQLTDGLAQGLDIRLNHCVSHIEYGDKGVCIHSNQGNFSADKVLITLPLGVLKSASVTFNPALPECKRSAIERLGMGTYNKLYLHFSTMFWDDTEILNLEGTVDGTWSNWFALHNIAKAPILCALYGGPIARQLELLDDKTLVSQALESLRTIYGDRVREPLDYRVTRWASDPFAKGSYSFPATGAHPEDPITLAMPINQKVYFAGEATDADHNATVHGALLSGKREAQRIINTR